MAEEKDFITKYMEFTSGSEVPAVFNRWSCIGGIGAILEQNAWFPFLNSKIYGNMYIMLVGNAGARKSTAIKGMRRLLQRAGYSHFAGEKTSKEQFLVDLQKKGMGSLMNGSSTADVIFDMLSGDTDGTTPCLIAADEFNDFFGNNIMEFLSMLGVLWDWEGPPYESRSKSGNVTIPNPNISILSGNTVDTLNNTFPVQALGQGFFSRLMFIYGEPNGIKIAFPEQKTEEEMNAMADDLARVRDCCTGEIEIEPEARKALEVIYDRFKGLDDERFVSYTNRRFTNLLKLCVIHAAAAYRSVISVVDVVRAHTTIVHAEHHMPSALGEYGRAKLSAVNHRILQILLGSYMPLSFSDLLARLRGEVEGHRELGTALVMLEESKRILRASNGYLAVRSVLEEKKGPLYDWSYLTDEERKANDK